MRSIFIMNANLSHMTELSIKLLKVYSEEKTGKQFIEDIQMSFPVHL